MAKHLVIVESPAKAKTLEKYLGKDYEVRASIGHIRDLPKSTLGVEVEKNFEPKYAIITGKAKVITELKGAAKGKKSILLASDPDREGEAIAWHLKYVLTNGAGKVSVPIQRVLFEEITKPAVLAAIKSPREINGHMFESQQARRILDRLVGYQVSPVLWDKVRRGLSAGRVQTVALRIICEREKEIRAFVAIEYWSIEADLKAKTPPGFRSYLYSWKGERIGKDHKNVGTGAEAKAIVDALEKATYTVKTITTRERKRRPVAPFITSRLQQDASRKLGYEPRRTMMVAQQLYEGIDIGEGEGPVGLITYMRTDATRVSPIAIEEVRNFISDRFGSKYLPSKPHEYKGKANAQEAHEAIRPTSVLRDPEKIKSYLTPEQFKVYDLIWKRFVASQMEAAVLDQTTIDIGAAEGIFRATGQVMKFDGFMAVYVEGREDGEKKDEEEGEENDKNDSMLPPLKEGETLACEKLSPLQHFTQPPPRFSQATLIKELEEDGIGRPSTYASIMSTILNREYADLDKNRRLFPTELGMLVTDLLVTAFPKEFDIAFTAKMEEELDKVSEAAVDWVDMLRTFYKDFEKNLEKAKVNMRDVKAQEIETGLECPDCKGSLIIRWGRKGEFLACKKYPDCKFTSNFERDENGKISIAEGQRPQLTDVPCPKCGKPTILRFGRFGQFRGCSGYPECKFVESAEGKAEIGMKCPACGKGDVVKRRSRWGKFFFGCTQYSKKEGGCTFISNYQPVDRECPKCKSKYLMIKARKVNPVIACPTEECDYSEPYEAPPSEENASAPAPSTSEETAK